MSPQVAATQDAEMIDTTKPAKEESKSGGQREAVDIGLALLMQLKEND